MEYTHAHLIVADDLADADIPEEYKRPDADIFQLVVNDLGIDDARSLVRIASTKPVNRNEKVIVIAFKRATVEAQNALLKLLEEPPAEVRFFVVVPHESVLLPTVRSRLINQISGRVKTDKLSPDTEAFLNSSLASRLTFIAEKQKAQDSAAMAEIVHELAAWMASEPQKFPADALLSVSTAERYIDIRGASRKALLENIALTLPAR